MPRWNLHLTREESALVKRFSKLVKVTPLVIRETTAAVGSGECGILTAIDLARQLSQCLELVAQRSVIAPF